MNKKRTIKTTIFSWLVFVGIDFFFHAGVIKSLWQEKVSAFLPDPELFKRIPFGYSSFLLLTILIGYVYNKIFKAEPEKKKVFKFAVIIASLFSVSNFLAFYSFLQIPIKQLVVFNLVYFIEILCVIGSYSIGMTTGKFRRFAIIAVLLFIVLIIAGIMIQNL